MEHLNKVQLRGVVGYVHTSDVSGNELTRFSVATNHIYKEGDTPVIETTWHSVSAWDKGVSGLKKGDMVEVEGRLRQQRYTAVDGSERVVYDVVASDVKVLG